MLEEQNQRAPLKHGPGNIVIQFPNSVFQGQFCWLSSEDRTEFWRERAMNEKRCRFRKSNAVTTIDKG